MVRRNKAASLATTGILAALAIGVGLAMTALVQKNAAKQQELDQSIRADTVTAFIDSLVSDQLPSLVQQGNTRAARALIGKADTLASTYLSNAPAAELRLRLRLVQALGDGLQDYSASIWQWTGRSLG